MNSLTIKIEKDSILIKTKKRIETFSKKIYFMFTSTT